MSHRQPKLAVDCIIRVGGKVLLIRRRNEPLGWALPGGFVEYGETVEESVRREMKEESGLDLAHLRQFHVYSDPARDPRGHCVSVVFTADGVGTPVAGDDAADWRLVDPVDAPSLDLAFDHKKILADYAASINPKTARTQAG